MLPFSLPSFLCSIPSLPSPTHFSSLDVNAATDTLCSTLNSCQDDICPLSSRPTRTSPSNPWLSDVLREAAERKWQKSNDPSDLSMYQSLLSSFSAEVHTAKSSHFHNKINNAPDMRNLFRTFNSLLCPPSPPPTTSITADDFATFFTDKNNQQSVFTSTHTGPPTNYIHCSNSHLLLLSPHWGGSIQTSPLQPSYNMSSRPTFSKQSLPHSYQHSHTLSTHLSSQASSPLHSSRLG